MNTFKKLAKSYRVENGRHFQTLIGDSDVSHFLAIGAYRDNEIDARHPLSLSLELLQKEQASVEEGLTGS